MSKFLTSLFIIIFSYTGFSQLAQIDIQLTAMIGSNSQDLRLGLDTSATNGIDPALGESILPPLPPSGAYDVRFDLFPYTQNYYETWKDYRPAVSFPFTGEVQHKLMWQFASGTNTIKLNYVLPDGASMNIKDVWNGQLFNSGELTGIGSYTINAPYDKAFITMTYTNISPSTQGIDEGSVTPSDHRLLQNYPNPFNPGTTITYILPTSSFVKLAVYDILGNQVKVLFNDYAPAGSHSYYWDGLDISGKLVSSGTYIYRISAGEIIQSNKMILMK